MKRLLALAIMAMIFTQQMPVQAQSFLNKMINKAEQVKKTAETIKRKVDNSTIKVPTERINSNTSRVDDESIKDENIKDVSTYHGLQKGNLIDTVNLHITSRTKIINRQLDSYNSLKLGDFHDGRAFVSGGYFIDKGGKVYNQNPIILSHDKLEWPQFSKGRALVELDRSYAIIDTLDNVIKEFPKKNINSVFGFDNGVGIIVTEEITNYSSGRKVQFIDVNGNNIFPTASNIGSYYQTARMIMGKEHDGMRSYLRYDPAIRKTRYGFLDSEGRITVKPQFSKVHDFSDGLAAVCEAKDHEILDSGNWGYVDKQGNMVIPFKFSKEPGDFHSGYALVEKRDGTKCLIDKSGNIVYTVPSGQEFYGFDDNGYGYYLSFEDMDNRAFIKVQGKPENKISYAPHDPGATIIIGKDGQPYVCEGWAPKKYGLINPKNMMNKSFGYLSAFSEGLAPFELGYGDENGNIVILFKSNEF